ncbi:VIT1/CCC1 transporter family protein [Mobiluncus holmesii]|uniref:VIT1/CCC1 transporter family protein n=1 Tax=Mobiluncus holmesii TaxID=144178 RepID=UPI000E086D0B|nr:VIT1/CCC1 transporter family protein [Mobiluncus holmesii]STY98410.1 VIT family [Mobiluncus holmesii]
MSNHLAHKPSEQLREVDEKHDQSAVTSSRLNRLRAAVLGANDGIVSTAGVVVGVAAANPENMMAIATAGICGGGRWGIVDGGGRICLGVHPA